MLQITLELGLFYHIWMKGGKAQWKKKLELNLLLAIAILLYMRFT